MDDKQKTVKAVKGANDFFGQFGEPDIYVRTVLEVFLEELMGGKKNEESLHLPSEEGQKGNKVGDGNADGKSNPTNPI
tara:strand:+ start:6702 stop:6935 length:234 start_codon:yes stop_codon:yes gene_type:complete